ncbi:hypothetical protein Bphy_6123 (plasmid) [Paraburkholderia phymatum STM815]|uniref:Uncharacterized protein n=1 Tax=Paraburkholderia phymatum (strain DSM 17167 / CIP 108236 / LMG 21445 / STM815) TaxID=391038 RepID=B2JW53_PARP8|nr:hypothetical protein Bphy_6123 [Paraburkholderia phymatum STM815]
MKNRARKVVRACFLSYRGRYLSDPNTAIAREAGIFSDTAGSVVLDNANPNAYFIVPANYSIDKAIDFSNAIAAMFVCNGMSSAFGIMTGAFWPKGSQDLQRTYPGNDGLDAGQAFVPAFTNAASFHFGLVSELSGIGEDTALHGGGALNRSHLYLNTIKNGFINLADRFGAKYGPTPLPDTRGVDGNNPNNVKSIHAGVLFARELRQRYGIHSPDLECSLTSPFTSSN